MTHLFTLDDSVRDERLVSVCDLNVCVCVGVSARNCLVCVNGLCVCVCVSEVVWFERSQCVCVHE